MLYRLWNRLRCRLGADIACLALLVGFYEIAFREWMSDTPYWMALGLGAGIVSWVLVRSLQESGDRGHKA